MSPAASLPHQSGIRETPLSREKCRLTVVMACSAVMRRESQVMNLTFMVEIILDSGKCMVNVLLAPKRSRRYIVPGVPILGHSGAAVTRGKMPFSPCQAHTN